MLKTALHWLNQGIAPIPILPKSKKPAIQWREYQTRLPTLQEIQSWFSHPRNLAIITGWRNLVVVDFDTFEAYNETMPPNTYSVVTARGVHCYYFIDDATNGQSLPGIDIKASGGYILAPPSIHPSGIPYVALDAATPILSVKSIRDVLDLPQPVMPQVKPKTNGNDLVSKIKQKVSIFDILPMSSNPRKSGNNWYIARCPFHEDNSPSFWIDSRRGLCGCFAGCTPQPLDVIDLFADLEDISLEDAIWELAGEF